MTATFDKAVLGNHTAVLGKTGSGKTSTSKLIVETVVDAGHRVCVLDPIKSDWWGLTSSADGKRPGLPFQILGGPHGHVPLHAGAGAAIGELVATGALPLSIIDMADFKAGGPNRFFNDFSERLMRKMKGVLYLVVEEAHEFAPKERSGVGDENMAVYYAKKLATAGRSKGIRLIVCSQAVQQLHNRVLGSCETLIVHRFTAPADQAPVFAWLKGNVESKADQLAISSSLRKLADGEAWICSGSSDLQRKQFPRIRTFDNSATPDHGDAAHKVVTAKVDQTALRELVGVAVAEAEANDPKVLLARITELDGQIARLKQAPAGGTHTAADIVEARRTGERSGREQAMELADGLRRTTVEQIGHRFEHLAATFQKDIQGALALIPAVTPRSLEPAAGGGRGRSVTPEITPRVAASTGLRSAQGAASSSLGASGQRRILISLAQRPNERVSHRRLSLLAGMSMRSGTWSTYLSRLRSDGHVEGREDLKITDAGMKAAGNFAPLPTGDELIDYWRGKIGSGSGMRTIFDTLVAAYPKAVAQSDLATRCNLSSKSGTWSTYLSRLRGLGLITGKAELCASGELFE